MNIFELEEGLRNLIASQPSILAGENEKIISGVKNIIEAHKAYAFRVEEYANQDILKVGLTGEISRIELNLTSYVCQVLQERGINIMLYVPKYAAAYNKEISKYVDDVFEKHIEEKSEVLNAKVEPLQETKVDNMNSSQEEVKLEKAQSQKPMQSNGRDYLMELLKK